MDIYLNQSETKHCSKIDHVKAYANPASAKGGHFKIWGGQCPERGTSAEPCNCIIDNIDTNPIQNEGEGWHRVFAINFQEKLGRKWQIWFNDGEFLATFAPVNDSEFFKNAKARHL